MHTPRLVLLAAAVTFVGGGAAPVQEDWQRRALLEYAEEQNVEIVAAPKEIVMGVPISPSREKFPGAIPSNVDVVEGVNILVNHSMEYVTDFEQYGDEEMWVMNPASMMGDCEDYVLTKLSLLRRVGVPIITNTRIITLSVHRDGEVTGHAILAVRFRSGEIAYLDNNFDRLMTRQELESFGYKFYDW